MKEVLNKPNSTTFSVVIPSFGQARYLEETIKSVLSQNIDPESYEVIVVDDGSTDGSFEIAKKYSPRIQVIHQVNKGLASARNTGIMNACGSWILPLDADDILLPDALVKLRDAAWSASLPDVVAPSIRCFNENGGVQDTILKSDLTFDDFKEGNRLPYCSAIRRSTLLAVGGYSPKMDTLGGYEDLHLWYDLLTRGMKFATLQEPLVMYRVKGVSMITEAKKNSVALWDQIIKDFPQAASHRP